MELPGIVVFFLRLIMIAELKITLSLDYSLVIDHEETIIHKVEWPNPSLFNQIKVDLGTGSLRNFLSKM